jgi:tripartite ATP-independent transporter DctP family solute receptor
MRRLHTIVTLFTLIGLICAATTLHAATELRFGHAQPPNCTLNLAVLEFKKAVATATKGELVINVFPGGALGGNSQMVQGVRMGSLDITANGNSFYTAFAPKNNVIDLPYLFNDYEHVAAVIDGPIGQSLLDELKKYNIMGLAFLDQGFRQITNNVHPIRVPDDIKGLKMRVAPDKAHVMCFQLLGANVVTMSFTEVYMAMQTKAIDAEENPVNTIISNRFQEVQKYLSMIRYAYTAGVLAMNLKKFNSLPQNQQTILLTEAQIMAKKLRQTQRSLEAEQLNQLRAAGMEIITDLDVAPFQKIVAEKTREDYVKSFGSDLLNRIIQAGIKK